MSGTVSERWERCRLSWMPEIPGRAHRGGGRHPAGGCRSRGRTHPGRGTIGWSRGAAVEIMQAGVRAVCTRLWSEGELSGVLCLGGAEGAHLGAAGMHALPLGVPKVILSPSASGRRTFDSFVGEKDVTVIHSVVDIIGLNPIARSVTTALSVRCLEWSRRPARRSVGCTTPPSG